MNTEEQTITKPEPEEIKQERIKNPKRVAQGKRLAEISRASKARKRAAQQEEETTSVLPQLSSLSTTMAMIGAASGVIGAYIAWRRFKQDQPEGKPQPLSQTKYNNLDDDDI